MTPEDPDNNNDNNNKIALTIGNKEYTINPTLIPYFQNWTNFETKLGRDTQKCTHNELTHFDTALLCIENGYRNAFRKLGTTLKDYELLCETLDYLLIDVINNRTLSDIVNDFRSIKRLYEESVTTKLAKDSAFRLLYMLYTREFEAGDCPKMFEAVLYVVSHRASFKHNVRSVVLEAYMQRFSVSRRQKVRLDEWPVYVDGVPFDDGEDETTDDEDETTDDEDEMADDEHETTDEGS